MTRALRSPRRIVAALFLLVSTLAVPAGVLGQTEDAASGTGSTALPSQDGWWNRAQGRQEAEPETPLRPVIGGTLPAPSTVPPDGLGVGAVLGEPDKVAAVGFLLEAPLDAFVDRLVLTLQESKAANANANAATAAIVACPITDFWASVKNGDFATRPSCDEGQSVPGVRSPEGTWSFDLSLLGASWLDGTLTQNGVLLREAVEPPTSFQVSFGDLTTDSIRIEFATSGGGFSASSDFTFDDDSVAEESFDSGTSTDDFGSFDDAATTFDSDSGTSFGSSGSSFSTSGATVAPAAPAAPSAQQAVPVSTTPAVAATDLFGNVPIAAVVLVAVLLLGGALFLGLVLGPLAAPAVAPARSGGVSQALAARQAAAASRR